MTDAGAQSPFHRGEREIQSRLGVQAQVEGVGRRFIRDHLPEEHREFYAQLPTLFMGTIDKSGRPWASVLVGRPGFLSTPDPHTLEIDARPIFGDPLNQNLAAGAPVGILGIEYQNRRRNRLTGEIASIGGDHIKVHIHQTFGNCPQYIQARGFDLLPEIDRIEESLPVQPVRAFDARAGEIIAEADNFYIATHFSEQAGNPTQGADVSHRGGRPGFVRLDDEQTLTFPDFSGNFHFNTLGNILVNPRAGLLFIDFKTGELLYLTGVAKVTWDSEEQAAFAGAERLVSFTLDEGFIVENAMPIRWGFLNYSPSLEQTGSWQQVEEKIAAREEGNVYRNYKVERVESTSESITSFYLTPEDGARIDCHKAGQFLPVEVQPLGVEKPVRRTYTISNAPNGSHYRLSIKRELPPRPELPGGVSSNYFHDHIAPGSVIRAMSPRGKFTLDESSTRPVVLISGGVGVTPMISMLEQLVKDSAGCGCSRQVWFIHGARNGAEQAFRTHVRELAADWPCLSVHVRYSAPTSNDIESRDYDSVGHVNIELIKSLLPFDDHEFYLCGPAPFMESVHGGLKSLNVADERIHYEFFGPGTTLAREPKVGAKSPGLEDRAPVAVRFARSGIETKWAPAKGTLLDLAESEGLQPAYSCRSGICQTCSTRIVRGDVDYAEPPMTPPPGGEALICSSYPKSNDSNREDEGIVLDL